MCLKKILLVFVTMNCLFLSCAGNPNSPVPNCLQQKFNQLQVQPVWNTPAEINEYSYIGKPVYLISAPCCDQLTMLVDENCDTLCSPGGGIGGHGDGKCEDFNKNAKFVRLVWKDSRSK
jgi:hypothetical protein